MLGIGKNVLTRKYIYEINFYLYFFIFYIWGDMLTCIGVGGGEGGGGVRRALRKYIYEIHFYIYFFMFYIWRDMLTCIGVW